MVAATEVMTGRPCFEVEFADGTVIVADAEHGWRTEMAEAGAAVRTTREIAATLWARAGEELRPNHRVRTTAPLQLADADVAVDAYAWGAAAVRALVDRRRPTRS